MSFFTIGIFWINHHLFFRHVKTVDHGVLMINVLLLMWISLWPFTTAVLAEYMGSGVPEFGAVMAYVGVSLAMALTWTIMYQHIRSRELLDQVPSREHERCLLRRNTLGFVGYLSALAAGPRVGGGGVGDVRARGAVLPDARPRGSGADRDVIRR